MIHFSFCNFKVYGNMRVSGQVYNQSDRRLKENIEEVCTTIQFPLVMYIIVYDNNINFVNDHGKRLQFALWYVYINILLCGHGNWAYMRSLLNCESSLLHLFPSVLQQVVSRQWQLFATLDVLWALLTSCSSYLPRPSSFL